MIKRHQLQTPPPSVGTDSSYKLHIKMAERQTSAEEEKKITSEDVSKWTSDLGEIILVQRARVRSLTAKPLMAETEMRKLESLESLLKDAIIAQDAHYKRQRAMNPASSSRKISRRAMLDFRYDVVMERYFTNNTHYEWRDEWMELWGLEVSEHREMIRVESHNSVSGSSLGEKSV